MEMEKKIGPSFSSFDSMSSKNNQKPIMTIVALPDKFHLISALFSAKLYRSILRSD